MSVHPCRSNEFLASALWMVCLHYNRGTFGASRHAIVVLLNILYEDCSSLEACMVSFYKFNGGCRLKVR